MNMPKRRLKNENVTTKPNFNSILDKHSLFFCHHEIISSFQITATKGSYLMEN
jgi:hypothetical protein